MKLSGRAHKKLKKIYQKSKKIYDLYYAQRRSGVYVDPPPNFGNRLALLGHKDGVIQCVRMLRQEGGCQDLHRVTSNQFSRAYNQLHKRGFEVAAILLMDIRGVKRWSAVQMHAYAVYFNEPMVLMHNTTIYRPGLELMELA